MAAGRVDLLFELNAAFDRAFLLRQSTTRVPVDFTGYTARMQVRATAGAEGAALLDLTTENGGITLGGVEGTIALYVGPAALLVALGGRAGAGYDATPALAHDLLLVPPNGRSRRLWHGSAVVSPGVTVSA